jgi:hypothetical protein
MNLLKRLFGYVWLLLAPALVLLACLQAAKELQAVKPAKLQETLLFWVIILLIFVPLMAGLGLFGWYATRDEYQNLPTDDGGKGF